MDIFEVPAAQGAVNDVRFDENPSNGVLDLIVSTTKGLIEIYAEEAQRVIGSETNASCF